MKSLHIDFIEDKKWRYTWIVASAALALVLIVHEIWAHKISLQQNELQQQLDSLQSRMLVSTATQSQDRRHAHALAVAHILQIDLDKIFQTLEALKEPSIRLQQLQINTASRQARVEYQFSQIEKITVISSRLNSKYSNHPWRFEGSTNTLDIGRYTPAFHDQFTIRGTWSCTLDFL